ncbi:MAG TPA: hypothetical protein VGV12_02055 [Gemmatimonadales bacterium]|nr:hypothetical protein [Gemmatimonadales bacterium]
MAADGGADRGGVPGLALSGVLAAGSISITPDRPLPLAGFTDRLEESTAVADPLELNALLLRRPTATLAILTADLLFVTQDLKHRIAARVRPDLVLDDASFLLAASHTHFAPAVDPSKPLLGPVDPAYVDLVVERGAALLRRLADANTGQGEPRIEYRSGIAAHAINRRRMGWRLSPRAPHLPRRAALRAPDPMGPRDETIHVVTPLDPGGRPRAVLWSYACHPVSFAEPQHVSADYPGVVRRALRAAIGGGGGSDLPVLFLQGCAGDIRPRELGRPRALGRRLAELVFGKLFTPFTPAEYRAWSESLAASVVEVARAPGRAFPLGSPFRTALTSLPLADLLDGVHPADRSVTLQRLEPAPGLAIEAISAEPVAEYGLAARATTPEGMVVIPAGYTDSVFGYLPTARMLGQHGYEDEGFMGPFGLTGRFRPDLEQVVGRAWRQLRAPGK